MINAYAREPLIYKGLLGVKIHYIIAQQTNDLNASIFIDLLSKLYKGNDALMKSIVYCVECSLHHSTPAEKFAKNEGAH